MIKISIVDAIKIIKKQGSFKCKISLDSNKQFICTGIILHNGRMCFIAINNKEQIYTNDIYVENCLVVNYSIDLLAKEFKESICYFGICNYECGICVLDQNNSLDEIRKAIIKITDK